MPADDTENDNSHDQNVSGERDEEEQPAKQPSSSAPEAPAAPERDSEFAEARNRLRRDYDVESAYAEFVPTFSKTSVWRLLRPDSEAFTFKATTKDRLIQYFKENHECLYDQVARLIEQPKTEKAGVLDEYRGEYRYFRFAAIKGPAFDREYVMGRIVVDDDGTGNPKFGHWSHDYDWDNPIPEHSGYLFRFGERLFFWGWRKGVLRLAIALTMDKKSTGEMHGLLVSVRNEHRDPFAARFILVPVENETLIKRLSSKKEEPENNLGAKTEGESAFHAISKGDNAFYMLIH